MPSILADLMRSMRIRDSGVEQMGRMMVNEAGADSAGPYAIMRTMTYDELVELHATLDAQRRLLQDDEHARRVGELQFLVATEQCRWSTDMSAWADSVIWFYFVNSHSSVQLTPDQLARLVAAVDHLSEEERAATIATIACVRTHAHTHRMQQLIRALPTSLVAAIHAIHTPHAVVPTTCARELQRRTALCA